MINSDKSKEELLIELQELKQSNEFLKIQSESLDLIINSSKGIIWAIDNNYCLLYANQAFQNALIAHGGKEMEVGQNVLTDEYPKEFIEFWKKNYEACFKEGYFSIESEVLWSDGIHNIENSLNVLKNQMVRKLV